MGTAERDWRRDSGDQLRPTITNALRLYLRRAFVLPGA